MVALRSGSTCAAAAAGDSPRFCRATISMPADSVVTTVSTSFWIRPECTPRCALSSSATRVARPRLRSAEKSGGIASTACTRPARSNCSAERALAGASVTASPGVAASQRVSWRERVLPSASSTPMGRRVGVPAEKIHASSNTPSTGAQVSMARSARLAARRVVSRRNALKKRRDTAG